ncbi:MAG: Spy/CpxP family protein refolding chaperone [Candidatus Accumulibacter sp.]|jgi:protein CpxP|uniref:Spy/CpxP family protein refolding chaperone n=1 Tax=Accumulibacter sp. TaxID=2053492 RepID=UPI0025887A0D|nr:Spy/CpxP family protein refolding chaperone [Accumulibacter sp.]MBK8116705.1 Spy/CpxP family protein refolding chaperone [Accumulibacter sp.]MBK8385685.1 Spy/CpxP family protein refolding chaperone [Accumulibacter sp.]
MPKDLFTGFYCLINGPLRRQLRKYGRHTELPIGQFNSPRRNDMKLKHKQMLERWALGLAIVAVPLVVAAHGPTPDAPGIGLPPPMMAGAAPFLPGGMPPGMLPMVMLDPMRGVELTEAQRDKVFALLHAEIPAEREVMKRVFKTMEEMRGLATTQPLDLERARALADRHGQAVAQLMLMHVKRDASVRELMTPEQRTQFDAAGKASDPRAVFKRP